MALFTENSMTKTRQSIMRDISRALQIRSLFAENFSEGVATMPLRWYPSHSVVAPE